MPSYLTTSDVATRLGVSLDTVRRWLRSGELKGTPFGRAGYRIDDADFQEFLALRRRQSQEPSPSFPEQYPLSNMAIEELMNAVGQELRTPLTTTRGALQQARRLLQRALESPLPDNAIELLTKLQDLLARAERQISAEMRLAGNLLDASRIEANKFELSPLWCNLVEIVRETVATQQELAAQRLFEQELPVDDLVAVIADADRIRQALTNYLTNALKFSPADQPIKISLEVRDAQAYVSVQDKGPGILGSERSRIWERFHQGQRQPVGSGSGLGLGLYITRAIIQQHRGQVGVESHSGEGSTFWFTLPLADETWH
jgi:excisionase family DNA binding protein